MKLEKEILSKRNKKIRNQPCITRKITFLILLAVKLWKRIRGKFNILHLRCSPALFKDGSECCTVGCSFTEPIE